MKSRRKLSTFCFVGTVAIAVCLVGLIVVGAGCSSYTASGNSASQKSVQYSKENPAKFLFVIDMQNDFVTGSLGSKEAVAIVPNLEKLIKEYSQQGYKVIFTRDTHDDSYLQTQEGQNLPIVHCTKDTQGWQIVDSLTKAAGDYKAIDKTTFGYPFWNELTGNKEVFTDSELKALQDGNAEIHLTGVCTDICVISNASVLKAMFPEVPITLHSDCSAATTPENQQAAINVCKSIQVKVV